MDDGLSKRARRRRRGPSSELLSADQQEAACNKGDLDAVVRLAERLDLPEAPKFYARGHRGVIYRCGSVVIKTSTTEATWLARCNALGLGPLLRGADSTAVAMDFVPGTFLGEFLETNRDVRPVLNDLIRQCLLLDAHGIDKKEMVRPQVLVVDESTCVLIDFERCSFSDRPSNLTGLCQYLTSSWVRDRLETLGLHIDVDPLRAALRPYKHGGPPDPVLAALGGLGDALVPE